MRVLVTGAAGFIGSHLAKKLVAEGHQVRGLLLSQENGNDLTDLGVDIHRGDLTRPDSLVGVAAGVDIVFHLAARTLDWGTRKQFEAIMVDGTRNLLAASHGHVARFVYCSSIAALGLNRALAGLKEDAPRQVCGIPYCDTKILAEDLVEAFCRQNDIDYTIIRPANVFGPGSVWVREILDAFKRGPVPLINKGRAPGAFVYIDNLVDGMVLAGLAKAAVGKTYHFRDDFPITWAEYLQSLGGWIGQGPKGGLPFGVAWTLGRLSEMLLAPLGIRPPMTRLAAAVMGLDNSVDAGLARRELGWESSISQAQAMQRIKLWVAAKYQASA